MCLFLGRSEVPVINSATDSNLHRNYPKMKYPTQAPEVKYEYRKFSPNLYGRINSSQNWFCPTTSDLLLFSLLVLRLFILTENTYIFLQYTCSLHVISLTFETWCFPPWSVSRKNIYGYFSSLADNYFWILNSNLINLQA